MKLQYLVDDNTLKFYGQFYRDQKTWNIYCDATHLNIYVNSICYLY
jgi:hypothetical protein